MMRTFLFVILYGLFNMSAIAQKTYVVSVGIADYQYINDLRYTEKDVEVFNMIMNNHTQEVYSLVGPQATHSNVIKTIRTVFAQAKAEDAVIFFFSGHGYEGGFCCYNMRPNSYIGGISYKEMQILFRNCRAGRKMIFADACFSGGMSKQRSSLTVQAVQNNDIMFFLSSQLDETSLELPDGPNGLFTYYLAKGLVGEADMDRNRNISVQEIYNYVSEGVIHYTEQIPHNQHPTLWGKCDRNMSVISW